MNYIISKETFYDEERELFYCYIGKDNREKTLLLTVWGVTEQAARISAEKFLELLTY